MPPQRKLPHRNLLIRPGAIGDCILSLPALEFLRAEYTEVWTPTPVAPLIRFADRVRSIASTGLDLLGLPGIAAPESLLARLREFDSIVSWYGSNRPDFRECVENLGLPVRFFPALPPDGERVHAADYFLRQAGGTGRAVPRLAVPAAERGNFAAIHPFSGSPRKNWPLERFQEVAAHLPIPVKWSAGPSEFLDGAVRFAELYELARWLASARLYIGNDSGITHLAAAVGTPTIAIFGPTDPAIWAPRGENVRIVHGDLQGIGADRVLTAAKEWI